MTREQKYTEQMRELGIYHEVYDPEIHTLAMMERENQRAVSRWKKEGADPDSKMYAVIEQQRRDILAHRDALGLTPKAMRRLKPGRPEAERPGRNQPTVLELVRAKAENTS